MAVTAAVCALMYHELERDGVPLVSRDRGYALYCIDSRTFEEHLRRLRAQGVRGISVGDFVAGGAELDSVIVTFDDGCASDLLAAAPALEQAGYRATFFVTAGWIGRPGFLSRDDVRELHERGFEIGSHGLTHRYLNDISLEEVERELTESRRLLEEIVESSVRHLSYPGGRMDRRVTDAVRRAGYRSASTSDVGFNDARTDVYRLRRIAVTRVTDTDQVLRWAEGRGATALRLKQSLTGVAKRVLGTASYERLRETLLERGDRTG